MKCGALEEDEAITMPALVGSSPGTASDGGARVHSAVRRMRWLREPLVQFLIIGVALFLINGALNHGTSQPGSSYQIALTIDDLRQLQSTFAAQWQRAPSPEEMRGLVESRVQQEVLYREALMLGLDKDDIIIKRRLAQKMQFLAEDVAGTHEPTTAELKAWYGKNSDRFALSGRFSFRHLYFSPDSRGERAHDDAMNALAKIGGEAEGLKTAATLADRFIFQDYYADRTPEELEKEFGTQFASAIPKLRPRSWQGPVESGYGWHLVFVDSVVPGRIPVFEEVEPDVKTAWLADQKQHGWQKAYEQMRAKYTAHLPGAAELQSASTIVKPMETPSASGEGPK
jgi:peptidyl-prolyl cis-trans isomerase C